MFLGLFFEGGYFGFQLFGGPNVMNEETLAERPPDVTDGLGWEIDPFEDRWIPEDSSPSCGGRR